MRTQSEIIKPLVPLRRIPKNRGTVVRNATEINPLSEKEIKNVVEVYSEANKAYYKNYLQKEKQRKNKNQNKSKNKYKEKKKQTNNLTYITKKSKSEEFDPLSLNPLDFRNKKFEENGSLLHLPGSNINAKYVPHNINSEYGICSMSYGTLHKSNPLLWGKDYKNHYELPTICSIVKSKHPIYSKPNVTKMFSKLSNNEKIDEKGNNIKIINNNNNIKMKEKKMKKKYVISNDNNNNNNNIDLSFKEYPHIDVKKVPTFGNSKDENDFPDLSTELYKSYNDTYTNSNYDESTIQTDGINKEQKNLDNFKESIDGEDTYDYSDFFDDKQMDSKNEKKEEINNEEYIKNWYNNKFPSFHENDKVVENLKKNNIKKYMSLQHNNNNNKIKCMFKKSDHNDKPVNKIYNNQNMEHQKNIQKNYKLYDNGVEGKTYLNQVHLMSTSKKKNNNHTNNDLKGKNDETYVLKNEKGSIKINCGDTSDKKKKKSKKKLNKQMEEHNYITNVVENVELPLSNEYINDNNISKSRKKKGSKKKIKNNSNLKLDKYKNSLNGKYFPIKTSKEIQKDFTNDTNLSNIIKNYNTKELNKPTIYECNQMDANKDVETKIEIDKSRNAYIVDNSSGSLKDRADVKIVEGMSLCNMYKDKYATNIYNTNNINPNKNQVYISRGINNSNIFDSQNMGLRQKGYYQLFDDNPKWKVQVAPQIYSSGVSPSYISTSKQPLTSIIHSQLSIGDIISCHNSNQISYITPDVNALKGDVSSQIKNTNMYSQINTVKSNGLSLISEPIILDHNPISNINVNRINVKEGGEVYDKNICNMIPWTKSLDGYKNFNNVNSSFGNIEKYSMKDLDLNTRDLYSNMKKNDIIGNMVCLDSSYKNMTNKMNDDVAMEKNGLIEEKKLGGIYIRNNNNNNNKNNSVKYFNCENRVGVQASPSYIHSERNQNLNDIYKGNSFKEYRGDDINDKVNYNMNNTVEIYKNLKIEGYDIDRRNNSQVNELIKISNDNLLNIQKKELLDILNEENKKMSDDNNIGIKGNCHNNIEIKGNCHNNIENKGNFHNNVDKSSTFLSCATYVNPLSISDGNTIQGSNKNNKKNHTNSIDTYINNDKSKINDCNNYINNNNNEKIYSHIYGEKKINEPSHMVYINKKRDDEKYLN
ncbi:conserved Plasmodium protein, unknown function [Plasmodium sp. gorilla clade G2]|uniref:conserved Plasmodium protein, unknown function n=1 Tax=Plasmodium sp. gorilla clade G2 TaxID=880535 RepID=UPI000D214832|nr:conserved Plasmodium protein, unknown function [Plasmodium sp. gorilla clade G2]SOV19922.1 conserved Plasmodium protein, unknown function [Plasmodium sp. gorilla clade G2]